VAIALGHGDGTFGPDVFVPCGSTVYAVEAADMNLDGRPDLIALYGATAGIFLNLGTVAVDPPSPPRLALEGLRPNPAIGDLHAAFTLSSGESAALELLDLSGRRVSAQEVGSLGPGVHVVTIARGPGIGPGIYWLSLRQGVERHVTRAVILE
jgi:hypothetical protein